MGGFLVSNDSLELKLKFGLKNRNNSVKLIAFSGVLESIKKIDFSSNQAISSFFLHTGQSKFEDK